MSIVTTMPTTIAIVMTIIILVATTTMPQDTHMCIL
jgi:hypothetical protein